MKAENIPEKIFELLASKSYEQLTEVEKNLVLRTMSEMEYREMGNTVRDFLRADKSIERPPEELVLPLQTKKGLSRIINYPVPLYQVAAGLLLLFGFFLMQGEYQTAKNTEYAVVRDTVQTGIPIAADKYPDKLIFNP